MNLPSANMAAFTTLASLTVTAATVTKASTSHHGHHLLTIPSHPTLPKNLRQRAIQQKTVETNDDDKTHIPLLPFSLQLLNIPASSPLATMRLGGVDTRAQNLAVFTEVNSPQVAIANSILELVSVMGANLFSNSSIYGDRFVGWNVGSVWSSEFIQLSNGSNDSSIFSDANISGSSSGPINRHTNQRKLQGELSTGTTTITIGHDSTVTFNGVYWVDDPTSGDVTDYLVGRMNEEDIKETMTNNLRPLVCSQEQILGDECFLEVGAAAAVVASDAPVAVEVEDVVQEIEVEETVIEEVVQEENVTQDVVEEVVVQEENVTQGVSVVDETQVVLNEQAPEIIIEDEVSNNEQAEPETIDNGEQVAFDTIGTDTTAVNDEPTDPSSDPASTTVNALTSESPAAPTTTNATDEDDNSNITIPIIAVGASMVAFAMAALIFIKVRNKKHPDDDHKLELNATMEMDDSSPMKNKAEAEAPWANNAYDAITGTSKAAVSSPRVSAAAAAATSATAQTLSFDNVNNKNNNETTNPNTKNIDTILDDFSDGGSSFISDSSAGNSTHSHISGLTGILGGSYSNNPPAPLLEEVGMQHTSSRLSVDNSTEGKCEGGYLPKNLQKGNNNPSTIMRKEEAFEGDYRTRSAMAKLNLKKDILHVECETHDAPEGNTNIGNNSGAKNGNDNGNNNDIGTMGYGVTRTISPKKSTAMMEQQRLAEQMSLRDRLGRSTKDPNLSKKSSTDQKQPLAQQKKKEKDENNQNEKDLILPVGFRRSDSVDLRSKDSGSDDSEEDYSDMV